MTVDIRSVGASEDYEFCRTLTTEAKVAAVPVSSFYHASQRDAPRHYARFCFCKKAPVLAEASERSQDLFCLSISGAAPRRREIVREPCQNSSGASRALSSAPAAAMPDFQKRLDALVSGESGTPELAGAALAVRVGDRMVFEGAAGCALFRPDGAKCERRLRADTKMRVRLDLKDVRRGRRRRRSPMKDASI